MKAVELIVRTIPQRIRIMVITHLEETDELTKAVKRNSEAADRLVNASQSVGNMIIRAIRHGKGQADDVT